MIRGLYGAATALNAAAQNQELVAENLAQATTPGYRRHGLVFETLGATGAPGGDPTGVRTAEHYTSFEPGPLQRTGNPLDLAVTGNGFFVLDGPRGPLYTRNGVFSLNAEGELQSQGGLAVRGTGGRIRIPPGTGRVGVSQDGAVLADNVEVGRLQLAVFPNANALQRAGTTLFEGPAGAQPEPGTVRVEQGYREGANVQLVNEMVSMLTGMRYYEAASKALQSLGETVGLNTKPQ